MNTSDADKINLKIIVDNFPNPNSKFFTAWGLSILINDEILFDCGPNPIVLVENLKKFDIDIASIKFCVISHLHYDHIAGIKPLLSYPSILFILPQHSDFDIAFAPEQLIINTYDKLEISDKIYLINFKVYKNFYEQVLVIETSRGKIVIVGCMHMGLENLLRRIEGKIKLIIGGFHTFSFNDNQLEKYINLLIDKRIEKIAPIHCSGEKFRNVCKNVLKEKYIEAYVGKELIFEI